MFWNQKSKEASEQAARMVELDAFERAIQSQVPFVQFTRREWSPSPTSCFSRSGFEREEVIGKHHSALCFPEDVKTRDYEGLWQDLRGGVSRSGRFIRQSKSGQGRGWKPPISHRHRRQGGADRQGRLGRDPAAIFPGAHPGPVGCAGQVPGGHRLPARWHSAQRQPELPSLLRLSAGRGGRQTPSPLSATPSSTRKNPNFWQ